MRKSGVLTSFGSMFYISKKASKSNYTDMVSTTPTASQFWLNEDILKKLKDNEEASTLVSAVASSENAAPAAAQPREQPTICVFKNVGLEEMLARCSPTPWGGAIGQPSGRKRRWQHSWNRVNLLGHGGQQKKYEDQGSLNELYDTGAPSKLFRDESKNYGSDLLAQWQALSHTRAASQTTFHHAGSLNIAQVFSLVTEEELRWRCWSGTSCLRFSQSILTRTLLRPFLLKSILTFCFQIVL